MKSSNTEPLASQFLSEWNRIFKYELSSQMWGLGCSPHCFTTATTTSPRYLTFPGSWPMSSASDFKEFNNKCQKKIQRAFLDMNILLSKKKLLRGRLPNPKLYRSSILRVYSSVNKIWMRKHIVFDCDWLVTRNFHFISSSV